MRFLRQFAIIALFLVFQVQGQRYPLLGLDDDDNEDLERRPKGLGHEGYDDHREALDWYKDVRESEAIKRSRPLQPKALEEIGKNCLLKPKTFKK